LEVVVGRLGKMRFQPGLYIYSGSAQNGLEHRLGRHFSKEKRKHWHIDHLLEHADLIGAFLLEGHDRECELNCMLDGIEGCERIGKGFGSSDCDCATHLHMARDESLPLILNEIRWMVGLKKGGK
jgi:Uri superfamily endonuclease